MHVAVQKRAHVFISRGNFMLVKDTEHNSRVGHARDLDIVQIIINAEAFFESRFERVDAGAARMDQRAVDVEKQQAPCSCCRAKPFAFAQDRLRRGIPVNHARFCHEIRAPQSGGACIIKTAMRLPRKTTSTIPRPIRIPLRTGSSLCSWRRRKDAPLKWDNSAPASAK